MKTYGKKYSAPAAIPFETIVEDANGLEWKRFGEGWFPATDLHGEGEALSTADLVFPVRVVLLADGEKKPRRNDRTMKRARGLAVKKQTRKRARAATRAAGEARELDRQLQEVQDREASRLQADEDRASALAGEGIS